MAAAPGDGSIQAVLLAEAQNEVSRLRTDVFSLRRLLEEKRQSEQALQRANEQLKAQVSELTASCAGLQQQASQLPAAQDQARQLDEQVAQLRKDVELAKQARRILENELKEERRQRSVVEEARASLEAERGRLLRQRDELQASLRVAQRRAEEAEEEALRAEEETAALRQELKAQQSLVMPPGGADPAATAPHGGAYSTYSNSGVPTADPWATAAPHQHDHPHAVRGAPHHSRQPSALSGSTALGGGGPAAAADDRIRQLMDQVEREREQAAALLASLHEAQAEKLGLQQQVEALLADAADLQHHQHQHSQQHHHHHEQHGAAPDPGQLQGGGGHGDVRDHGQRGGVRRQEQGTQTAPFVDGGEGGAGRQAQHSQQANGHHHHHHHAHGDAAAAARHSASGAARPGPAAGDGSAAPPGMARKPSWVGSEASSSSDELRHLQAQVSKLKASRDKLLEQIDRQWEEMDRLGQENRGLSDELDRAQQLALLWEAQAQGSLAAEERLKDMLEEAAGWSTGGAGNAGAAAASGAASAEAALLNERAKVAELELRVRALAAELMRAQQATMAFGRAVLPTLSGIELRLTNTLAQQQQHAVGKAPSAAAGALQAVH